MKIIQRTMSFVALVLALFATLPAGASEKAGGKEKAAAPAEVPGKAVVDPAKEKAIRHLMKISKVRETGQRIIDGVKEAMQRSVPSSVEAWKDFPTEKFLAEFEDALVGVYDRHLTLDEVKALVEFYESPEGRQILEKMRAIGAESAVIGQEFSAKVLQQIIEKNRGAHPAH